VYADLPDTGTFLYGNVHCHEEWAEQAKPRELWTMPIGTLRMARLFCERGLKAQRYWRFHRLPLPLYSSFRRHR